eukprot:TRINITY_DN206_c1_g1_i1.p1 TRINITY_DN206_c1_g1~~TRINITY_DN206_c1_g1_i1.p1  ORF type:complete len:391 (-),score=129.89 TRINITY_DN206_c1_g1_i1:113-1195(-)
MSTSSTRMLGRMRVVLHAVNGVVHSVDAAGETLDDAALLKLTSLLMREAELAGHTTPLESKASAVVKHLRFSESFTTALPSQLTLFFTNLSLLDLRHNALRSLPPSIALLENLSTLLLCHNAFTELPEQVGACKRLKILMARENQLTALPDTLTQCTLLLELHMDSNKLQALPEHIGDLSNLKTLYAQNNALRTLPRSVGRCHNLERIDLRRNALETLPFSIGHCEALRSLRLGGNPDLKEPPLEEARGWPHVKRWLDNAPELEWSPDTHLMKHAEFQDKVLALVGIWELVECAPLSVLPKEVLFVVTEHVYVAECCEGLYRGSKPKRSTTASSSSSSSASSPIHASVSNSSGRTKCLAS